MKCLIGLFYLELQKKKILDIVNDKKCNHIILIINHIIKVHSTQMDKYTYLISLNKKKNH